MINESALANASTKHSSPDNLLINGKQLWAQKIVRYLPIYGTVLFVVFYFFAASVYPGGTRFDHSLDGYSHFENFWCDLLNAKAYNGSGNPARPIALFATLTLPLSLISFFYFVPSILNINDKKTKMIRWLGCSSMALASMLPFAHDIILRVAPVLLIITCFVVFVCLYQNQQMRLLSIGLLAAVLVMCNYFLWTFNVYIELMSIVQKMAIAVFLHWVGFMTIAYNKILV